MDLLRCLTNNVISQRVQGLNFAVTFLGRGTSKVFGLTVGYNSVDRAQYCRSASVDGGIIVEQEIEYGGARVIFGVCKCSRVANTQCVIMSRRSE